MKNKLLPYFYLGRFHSLSGAWLLLLPSFWSLALNYSNQSIMLTLYYYGVFFVGALLMRAFGCVINDMADIKFDQNVERTKNRPLARGDISKFNAVVFLLVLAIIPALILLSFNNFAKIVALGSLFFVVIYPFTKRFFKAPQLILGLTFNWGIILADAVMNGSISGKSWVLYGLSIIWTVAYDTIYAYQDYEYDKKIGINSTALLIGERPLKAMLVMYLLVIVGLFVVGMIANLSSIFYGILSLSGAYLLYKLVRLDHKNSSQCFAFFKDNVYFAGLIWLGILI